MKKVETGKVYNAIYILKKLMNYELLSRTELSQDLGVTPRQVSRSIQEIRRAGIDVKSKTGKLGGYYLDKSEKCPLCRKNNELI